MRIPDLFPWIALKDEDKSHYSIKDQVSPDEELNGPVNSAPACRYEDPEKLQKDRHFRCKYNRAIDDLIYVGKLKSSLADSHIGSHKKNC